MTYQALIGKQAPSLSLPNYTGETFTLTPGEKGLPIALFFYPKSGSYGCTKEACQFRDAIAEKDTFGPDKVQVVGISPDSVAKQKTFVEKNKLTYPVLSDEQGEARKAYSVGKGLMGFSDARVTFIIDAKGVVRDALDATLNFGGHSKFIGKWLDKLEAEAAGVPAPTPEVETTGDAGAGAEAEPAAEEGTEGVAT